MTRTEIATGLRKLYVDTLRQIAARLGASNPSRMSKAYLIHYICNRADHGMMRDWIIKCVNECEQLPSAKR